MKIEHDFKEGDDVICDGIKGVISDTSSDPLIVEVDGLFGKYFYPHTTYKNWFLKLLGIGKFEVREYATFTTIKRSYYNVQKI